jgi:hypothetical protein
MSKTQNGSGFIFNYFITTFYFCPIQVLIFFAQCDVRMNKEPCTNFKKSTYLTLNQIQNLTLNKICRVNPPEVEVHRLTEQRTTPS